MATLISGINSSFFIKTGLNSTPTADLGCTTSFTLGASADMSTVACLGSVLKSGIAGAKTVTCSFSGATLDSAADPVDILASTGIYISGPVAVIIDWGNGAGTTKGFSGYLQSFEYGLDASGNNTYSGTIAVSQED